MLQKLSVATSEYFGQSRLSGNPASANPQSMNPQSVNPQSVNPLSVNPSSVKSDDPKSVEPEKKAQLAPKDAYNSAMDEFLAVCDQIEISLVGFSFENFMLLLPVFASSNSFFSFEILF